MVNKTEERLKILLANAISLLFDETYETYESMEDFVENLTYELGTTTDEIDELLKNVADFHWKL